MRQAVEAAGFTVESAELSMVPKVTVEIGDEPTAKALAATAVANEQREISDPYAIEVHADGGTIDPLTARQRIRANGPTVPLRRPDTGLSR